jgi:phosphatidate cytidylyltransferase
VGVPVILGLLYAAPPWAFYLLALVVSLVGVDEFLNMTHPKDMSARVMGVALSAVTSIVVYLGFRDSRAVLAVLVAVPVIGPLVTLVRVRPLATAALRACAMGLAPLLIVVPLTLLAVMRSAFGSVGAGAVVLALGLAWFADTSAYFAGRFLGQHKLYAAVSPNKTVEGALVGLVASVVWALVAAATYLRGALPFSHALPLAIVAGLVGQAGDLGESLIKRSVGVKDSGALVPGHGGVLDRVDAAIPTTVAVFLYTQWAWS